MQEDRRREEGEEGERRRQGAGEGRGAFRTEKQPLTNEEKEREERKGVNEDTGRHPGSPRVAGDP